MTKWGQVGIILAILLSFACIGLGVMYYQENEKRLTLENELQTLLEEKTTLESTLNKKEMTINQLNQSIKDMKLEYSLNLEKKETQVSNLIQELTEVKEERTVLESNFSKLKDMRKLLEKRVSQVKEEKDKIEQRLSNLMEKNKSLLARLGNAGENETQITLDKIVVQESPSWQGEVLAVDNDYGYAVISLGMKKGLPENILLGFFRGEENIAQGKILKLYENTSVVKIIKQNKQVSETDTVKSIQRTE